MNASRAVLQADVKSGAGEAGAVAGVAAPVAAGVGASGAAATEDGADVVDGEGEEIAPEVGAAEVAAGDLVGGGTAGAVAERADVSGEAALGGSVGLVGLMSVDLAAAESPRPRLAPEAVGTAVGPAGSGNAAGLEDVVGVVGAAAVTGWFGGEAGLDTGSLAAPLAAGLTAGD